MRLPYLFLLCLTLTAHGFAQRPYGHEKAIPADSMIFTSWASHCNMTRGYQNIADTALGFASYGNESDATGPAKQNGVVSLGDGGMADITFENPVFNGPGADFVVFENGFSFANDSTFYLELAFVEVSSDGIHYTRFPASSLGDTITQKDLTFGSNPKDYHNIAGNYVYGYGTPFDLDELTDTTDVNINRISHIRLIDVIGSLQDTFAKRDMAGRKMNDPWPTPFASSGFDLDAIGGIHTFLGVKNEIVFEVEIYPNPISQGGNLSINLPSYTGTELTIQNLLGERLMENIIDTKQPVIQLNGLERGIYFLILKNNLGSVVKKICVE